MAIVLPASTKLTFGTKVTELNSIRAAALEERATYEPEWRDISDYMRIRRSRAQTTQVAQDRRRARSNKWLHEQGIFASRTLGAGMLAGVSSPSRPWLKMTTSDRELNEFRDNKLWLDDVTRQLLRVFAVSNYYHQKQTAFQDMGDYGQGPVLIDEDFDDVINCYASPVGEYYMSINHKGVVDTLGRDMSRTVLQLMQRFGPGKVPREVQFDYDKGNYQRMYMLCHLVMPNVGQVKGMAGPRGMPFRSSYWCPGVAGDADNAILEVSGYSENPISAPRWDIQANDVYGDGPGSLALPAVKSLQALEKRKGQIVDKLAVPPLQGPASMKRETVTHRPGEMTYYPQMAGGQAAKVEPTYIVDPRALPAVSEEGAALMERIDRAYFADLFLRLAYSDRRQVTAREIEEIHEEKLIALGPVLERTHHEGLNMEIKRTLGILMRKGAVRPPPPSMRGADLKTEFTSLLAIAQRAVGIGTIERFSGYMGSIIAANPETMDKWDLDQTVDEYADMSGVPASIIRSDDQVQEIRDARNKAAQQQEQMDQLQQATDIAAQASQADTGRRSNLLADIIGNQGRVI